MQVSKKKKKIFLKIYTVFLVFICILHIYPVTIKLRKIGPLTLPACKGYYAMVYHGGHNSVFSELKGH